MNPRLVAPVAAGLLILSTAAHASIGDGPIEQHGRHGQKTTADLIKPYEHCIALQEQFDAAVKTSGAPDKVREATRLRSDAHMLCGGNQQTAGITKMQRALRDIGVTPIAPSD